MKRNTLNDRAVKLPEDNPAIENDPELQALAARLEEIAPTCVADLEFRESLRSRLLDQLRAHSPAE